MRRDEKNSMAPNRLESLVFSCGVLRIPARRFDTLVPNWIGQSCHFLDNPQRPGGGEADWFALSRNIEIRSTRRDGPRFKE